MLKKTAQKIHDLRIFLFAFILVSFLFSVGINPIDIGRFFGAKFSNAIGVGAQASIPPNPFNTLALQLEEKELMLRQKEKEIAFKEDQVVSTSNLLQSKLILLLIGGMIVLFFLIIFNYFFDWKRRRQQIISLKNNNK